MLPGLTFALVKINPRRFWPSASFRGHPKGDIMSVNPHFDPFLPPGGFFCYESPDQVANCRWVVDTLQIPIDTPGKKVYNDIRLRV